LLIPYLNFLLQKNLLKKVTCGKKQNLEDLTLLVVKPSPFTICKK
jgi:hypothetical protein